MPAKAPGLARDWRYWATAVLVLPVALVLWTRTLILERIDRAP